MLSDETGIVAIGKTRYLKIPYTVFNDSAFPFKDDDQLEITVKGKELVVKKR